MSSARFVVVAAAVGLVVSLVRTHPLLLAPATTVLEDGTLDAFQFIWNLWWARESLLVLGTNPFHTTHLYFPSGVGLLFHTFSFALGLASIPLQALPGGPVTAHNLLVAASPGLGVVTVALLAREAGADEPSAVLAGVAAALSPVATWFLPVLYLDCWYLLALLVWAWWRTQTTRSASGVAATVAVLVTTIFASPEYAMMGLALLALDTVARTVAPRAFALAPCWARGSLAFWALAFVVLGTLLAVASAEPAAPPPRLQLRFASAYAAGFVTPPWLLAPGRSFWTLLYLGTVPLLAGIVTIVSGTRRARIWALALAATLLMAMGPLLHVVHPLGWAFDAPLDRLEAPDVGGVPGPYLLFLEGIPILRFFRAPYRWMVPAVVALTIVMALGITRLRTRLAGHGPRRLVTALLALAVVSLGLLDARGLRAPIASARVPLAYHHLTSDPEPCAVLELPSGIGAHFALLSSRWMFHQTVHRKYLLEGTVARLPAGAVPVVEREIADFADLPYVKYVVIHRDALGPTLPESRRQVATVETLLARQADRLPTRGPTEVWRLRTFRPETVGAVAGAGGTDARS